MVENNNYRGYITYPLYFMKTLKNFKNLLDKIAILSYNILVTHRRLNNQKSKRRKIS